MADTPIGPGTVLAGRFGLEDLLDDNDGARCWRATDQVLARSVAVHVLPDRDPRAEALLDAARSSALVSDPRLLRVLDAAAADGVVYVVHEWGSGVSLDRMLAERTLSPRRAAWLVKEVAEAIVTAHRSGVAHGRLLPENVLISESGSVKLVGFVIDAALRTPDGRRRATDGEPVTAEESDVLNLAALLYAALVGRWPGTEGSALPVAPTEHGRPLRPRRVRAGVPRPLDAICEQVLNAEAHPGAAPIHTAHEIQAALSDFVGDPGGSNTWGQGTAEHTAVLDRAGLAEAPTGTVTEPTGTVTEATGPAVPVYGDDPEATRAGAPMFFDEDTGIGWLTGTESRGLRTDGSDPGAGGENGSSLRTPVAPPPALPQLPERPLFADDAPTAPSSAASSAPRGSSAAQETGWSGASASDRGPVKGQSGWGPVAAPVPGRRWLRLALLLAAALVLVVAAVVALDLGRGRTKDRATTPTTPSPSITASASTTPTPTPVAKPVQISAVTDFDPQGSPPQENPQLAPLAFDGNPATAWHTSTYYAPLDKLKAGVGLLVDLGKPSRVGQVRVTLQGSPTALQILAAPSATSAPSDTTGLPAVASDPAAGTQADLTLTKAVSTRWLVVWLTSLPAVPGGYQGRVAEISVRS